MTYVGPLVRGVASLLLTEGIYGQPLQSSVLRYAKFNSKTDVLTLTFVSGRVYEYPSSMEQFQALLNAPSKGRYFNQYIK